MTPGMPQPIPTMKITCAKCQGEMIVRIPQMRLFNAQDLSSITWVHNRLEKCPNCGAQYLNMLQGIDPEGRIQLSYVPVETNESAIVPPTDQNMAAAKANQEMANKMKLIEG
jgi:hypothetical protein